MATRGVASMVSTLALLVVFVRSQEVPECFTEIVSRGRCIPVSSCPEIQKLTTAKSIRTAEFRKLNAVARACGGNIASANFLVCCEISEDTTERVPTTRWKPPLTTTTTTTTRLTTTTTRLPITTTRPTTTTTRPTTTTTTTRRPTTTTTTTRRPTTTTTTTPKPTTTTTTTPKPTTTTTINRRPTTTTTLPTTTTTRPSTTTTISPTGAAVLAPRNMPQLPAGTLPKYCGRQPSSDHIYGTTEDKDQVHSWAVFLEISDRGHVTGRCVGTVITDRFILTAAHCLHGLDVDDLRLYFGLFRRSELDKCLADGRCQERRAARLIVHEGYVPDEKVNDVALVQIEDALRMTDHVSPICLPVDHTFDESSKTYTPHVFSFGWGITVDNELSDTKRVAILKVIREDECAAKSDFSNATDLASLMCTFGMQKGMDVCSGDSGAPLVQLLQFRMYVVGVVSYGPVCGTTSDRPGKAIRVSYYIDWILAAIQRRVPPTAAS